MRKLYTTPKIWEMNWTDAIMTSTTVDTMGGVSNLDGEGVFVDFFGNQDQEGRKNEKVFMYLSINSKKTLILYNAFDLVLYPL